MDKTQLEKKIRHRRIFVDQAVKVATGAAKLSALGVRDPYGWARAMNRYMTKHFRPEALRG